MTASIKLIDDYRQQLSIKTNRELAKKLRVTDGSVSNWMNGRNQPDAESIMKMCAALGESPAKWLTLVEAERAKTPAARKAWLQVAQQLAMSIVICIAVYAPISLANTNSDVNGESIHYAKSRIRPASQPRAGIVAQSLAHGCSTPPASPACCTAAS